MGREKYPWNDWFTKMDKGKGVTLQRGKDYKCLTRSFMVMAYTQARFRDVRISCKSIGEDKLKLTLSEGEE